MLEDWRTMRVRAHDAMEALSLTVDFTASERDGAMSIRSIPQRNHHLPKNRRSDVGEEFDRYTFTRDWAVNLSSGSVCQIQKSVAEQRMLPRLRRHQPASIAADLHFHMNTQMLPLARLASTQSTPPKA